MRPPAVTGKSVSPRLIGTLTLMAVVGCAAIPSGSDWKAERKYGAYMARQGYWREALFRFERAAE